MTGADNWVAVNDAESTISPLAASVSFKSKLPSLLLEDIEHLVDRIQCKPESIKLTFASKDHMETARTAFVAHTNLVIVTSHLGCNNEDSRIPWMYAWNQLFLAFTRLMDIVSLDAPFPMKKGLLHSSLDRFHGKIPFTPCK